MKAAKAIIEIRIRAPDDRRIKLSFLSGQQIAKYRFKEKIIVKYQVLFKQDNWSKLIKTMSQSVTTINSPQKKRPKRAKYCSNKRSS